MTWSDVAPRKNEEKKKKRRERKLKIFVISFYFNKSPIDPKSALITRAGSPTQQPGGKRFSSRLGRW
jgi:hypothetical protein